MLNVGILFIFRTGQVRTVIALKGCSPLCRRNSLFGILQALDQPLLLPSVLGLLFFPLSVDDFKVATKHGYNVPVKPTLIDQLFHNAPWFVPIAAPSRWAL